MIGNEVVFDHIEDFNVAMESPARHELRAHYHEFPRFAGANTHYPMSRSAAVWLTQKIMPPNAATVGANCRAAARDAQLPAIR